MKVLFKNDENVKKFTTFLDEHAVKDLYKDSDYENFFIDAKCYEDYLSGARKRYFNICYDLYKVNELQLVEFDIVDIATKEEFIEAHQKVRKAINDCNGLEFEYENPFEKYWGLKNN